MAGEWRAEARSGGGRCHGGRAPGPAAGAAAGSGTDRHPPAGVGRAALARSTAALALALAVVAPQAAAWDHAGHQVVAAIAWEAMHPETRRSAVELLAAAPAGSGLAEMAPAAPAGERGRRHFLLAATWPDRVRGGEHDRPTWHWVNRFWRDAPDGPREVPPPVELPAENLLERLQALPRTLGDARAPAGERAVALAWLLHLVGDAHQPFHTSARITDLPAERRGDRGGNTFELHVVDRASGRRLDLHAYWDRLLPANLPRRRGEPAAAWIDRAAAELARRHPPASLGDLAPGDFDAWIDEGVATAHTTAYRHGLQRGRRPPERYRRAAWAAAAPALVRAGHRLAALLDESLRRPDDESARASFMDSRLPPFLVGLFSLLGGSAFIWRLIDLYRHRLRVDISSISFDADRGTVAAEVDNNGLDRVLLHRYALIRGVSMGDKRSRRRWVHPPVEFKLKLIGERTLEPISSHIRSWSVCRVLEGEPDLGWVLFPRLLLRFSNRSRRRVFRFRQLEPSGVASRLGLLSYSFGYVGWRYFRKVVVAAENEGPDEWLD